MVGVKALKTKAWVYMMTWPKGDSPGAPANITISLDKEGFSDENSFKVDIPVEMREKFKSGTKLEILIIPVDK